MDNIKVPKPQFNVNSRIEFAIETAFNTLVSQARNLSLPVNPCMGLVYLPTQEISERFKVVCRDVLNDLGVSRIQE